MILLKIYLLIGVICAISGMFFFLKNRSDEKISFDLVTSALGTIASNIFLWPMVMFFILSTVLKK